ncbi:hypothetical protein [Methanosarcina sp. Kolksee]|nr:hypothetical protein [Methanosarcina sp. Kolksee]
MLEEVLNFREALITFTSSETLSLILKIRTLKIIWPDTLDARPE